jgi:hypothetical protein
MEARIKTFILLFSMNVQNINLQRCSVRYQLTRIPAKLKVREKIYIGR